MYAPCSRRMEEVLITRDREFGSKKSICTILLTLILIFLFIFSPFTTPSPSPFVLSVLYKCIVSLPRWYKSFFFGHFLSFSFSFENSHIHVKILYSVYAFFLFIFYQFNSQDQPETKRGQSKIFLFSYMTDTLASGTRS